MNQESLRRIDDFLVSSTQALFKSHGLELSQDGPGTTGASNPITATIGFTAEGLRGLLVLGIDRALATRSLPKNLQAGAQGDEIIADWAGELSNQLLGRLKNKFHSIGIDISLSTPIVFAGKDIRHYCNDSPIHRRLRFAEGLLLIEFSASYDEDFEVPESVEAEEAGQPEGEALFF